MLLQILLNVTGPIIVMIAIGAFLRRKFNLDVATLSKLNIYFAIPAFIFHTIAYSQLNFAAMSGIIGVTVAQTAILGVLIFGFGRLFKISHGVLASIALAVMFYNSANYGLPLAELAYPAESGHSGGAVQAFVVMTQNLLTFTVGLSIAASMKSGFAWNVVWRMLKLPMIPALLLGLLAKWYLNLDPSNTLPIIIAKPAQYIAGALVPLALGTLGAQLAQNPQWPRWKHVMPVLGLRLIYAPVQMAGMLYLLSVTGIAALNLWPENGWPAQLLILTAAVPTAVNTLLLTIELEGDAKLAADCVFWTTVCSCLTIPLWIYGVWAFFGVG
jgi:predicted permease